MSNFPEYTTKTFSPTQKFFVLDPNTGNPAFVQGSDLVSQLTPNSSYVFAESTRTTAQATDYELGAVIQTGGATAAGDNLAGVYLVVPAGDGDFPMDNGLELLTLAGDDTLLERLALNTVGDGSDLVAHTGTDDTVTEALNQRTIYVGSVAELRSSSGITGDVYIQGYYGRDTPGGGHVYLDEDDTTSSDDGAFVFVDSDGGRWKRSPADVYSVYVSGAISDFSEDSSDAIQALLSSGKSFEGDGNFSCLGLDADTSNTSLKGATPRGLKLRIPVSGAGQDDKLLVIQSSDFVLENFDIDGNGESITSLVDIDTRSNAVNRPRIIGRFHNIAGDLAANEAYLFRVASEGVYDFYFDIEVESAQNIVGTAGAGDFAGGLFFTEQIADTLLDPSTGVVADFYAADIFNTFDAAIANVDKQDSQDADAIRFFTAGRNLQFDITFNRIRCERVMKRALKSRLHGSGIKVLDAVVDGSHEFDPDVVMAIGLQMNGDNLELGSYRFNAGSLTRKPFNSAIQFNNCTNMKLGKLVVDYGDVEVADCSGGSIESVIISEGGSLFESGSTENIHVGYLSASNPSGTDIGLGFRLETTGSGNSFGKINLHNSIARVAFLQTGCDLGDISATWDTNELPSSDRNAILDLNITDSKINSITVKVSDSVTTWGSGANLSYAMFCRFRGGSQIGDINVRSLNNPPLRYESRDGTAGKITLVSDVPLYSAWAGCERYSIAELNFSGDFRPRVSSPASLFFGTVWSAEPIVSGEALITSSGLADNTQLIISSALWNNAGGTVTSGGLTVFNSQAVTFA